MIAILVAAAVSLCFTLFLTPAFIRMAHRLSWGQFVREDGPKTHYTKRGTPTMGGVMIIGGTVLGYFVAKLVTGESVSASGVLMLFLMVGLGGVGFVDDFIKIRNHRSLGLTPWAKMGGELVVTGVFAFGILQFKNHAGLRPASTSISFVRDLPINLFVLGPAVGAVLFFIWIYLITSATSNAVNLTDGLDGLAAGAGILSFGAYAMIAFWQFNQSCVRVGQVAGCYVVRNPLDLVIITASITAALAGFLWWNTSPAKLFMGDTGSLALGGALAAVAILSRTEILLVVVGGLFVITAASVIIQTGYFKLSHGKRVFLMAPLHHHFELKGWAGITVVIRFWILAGLFAISGFAIFYAEWVAVSK